MSKDKRRSIFGRSGLAALTAPQLSNDDSQPASLLRKRRTASFMSNLSDISQHGEKQPLDAGAETSTPTPTSATPTATPTSATPRLTISRGSLKRASSVFGSIRGHRTHDDDEPLSATSTRTSAGFGEYLAEDTRDRQVLHYGEVQTSSSMFRKKKEFLVLTERHLIRYKSQAKAAEAFPTYVAAALCGGQALTGPSIPSPYTRTPSYRHSPNPSTGSAHELQSLASESSGDRDLGTPLRHIVAVYHLDDGRPHFAIELYWLDVESNHASCMTLQFGDPDDMHRWLVKLRTAANSARLADANPLSPYNSHLAARVVEAERDYVPLHYAIYKVVLRPQGKATSRSSSDDLAKVSASVCFLAIGVHKVHLIPLFKRPSQRTSSPSLNSQSAQSSHGILTLTELCVSEVDDTFLLTFR
jgi:hypothetical protein